LDRPLDQHLPGLGDDWRSETGTDLSPKPSVSETMAVAEANLSRRTRLGAAFALTLARHPGPDPGSIFSHWPVPKARWTPDQVRGDGLTPTVTKWDRAFTSFRNAEAALAAVQGADDIVRPAIDSTHPASFSSRSIRYAVIPAQAGISGRQDAAVSTRPRPSPG
jgi:hypothetical protein